MPLISIEKKRESNEDKAEIISKAHPNMRIVAAEGYYVYSKLQNGKYKISGIDAIQDSGDNLGYIMKENESVENFIQMF